MKNIYLFFLNVATQAEQRESTEHVQPANTRLTDVSIPSQYFSTATINTTLTGRVQGKHFLKQCPPFQIATCKLIRSHIA